MAAEEEAKREVRKGAYALKELRDSGIEKEWREGGLEEAKKRAEEAMERREQRNKRAAARMERADAAVAADELLRAGKERGESKYSSGGRKKRTKKRTKKRIKKHNKKHNSKKGKRRKTMKHRAHKNRRTRRK